MINIRIIYRILGSLLFIESSLLLICLALSLYYRENDSCAFGISILVALFLGLCLKYMGRHAENRMSRKDGYLIVSLAWVLFSLIGMLPFVFSGYIPSVCDAFFETMSGFTSTGASVVDNLDTFPHGLLFWRSFTQWIGGLGIVFFTLAILPSVGLGDVKLFAAEASGVRRSKLHPRIRTTAKWIWSLYLFLMLACTGCLFLCGMDWFSSFGYAFATTATGGFALSSAGIMGYHSPAIEYTLIVFMFMSGVNFALLYAFLVKGKIKNLITDSEFRCYLSIVVVASLLIAFMLVLERGYSIEHALRAALFQVVTLQTTTGFCSDDFMFWPMPTWGVLMFVMLTGACAGSTSGGMKCIRIVMLFKLAFNEFRRILHPKAIMAVRVNHDVITSSLERTLIAFTVLYVTLCVIGTFLLVLMGVSYMEAFSISLSSLSNVGPSIGYSMGSVHTWSALPDAGKWLCSFLMLAGRLEIFSLLLLLTPRFWKEN